MIIGTFKYNMWGIRYNYKEQGAQMVTFTSIALKLITIIIANKNILISFENKHD